MTDSDWSRADIIAAIGVIVAVIALIAGVAIPAFFGRHQDQANEETKRRSEEEEKHRKTLEQLRPELLLAITAPDTALPGDLKVLVKNKGTGEGRDIEWSVRFEESVGRDVSVTILDGHLVDNDRTLVENELIYRRIRGRLSSSVRSGSDVPCATMALRDVTINALRNMDITSVGFTWTTQNGNDPPASGSGNIILIAV